MKTNFNHVEAFHKKFDKELTTAQKADALMEALPSELERLEFKYTFGSGYIIPLFKAKSSEEVEDVIVSLRDQNLVQSCFQEKATGWFRFYGDTVHSIDLKLGIWKPQPDDILLNYPMLLRVNCTPKSCENRIEFAIKVDGFGTVPIWVELENLAIRANLEVEMWRGKPRKNGRVGFSYHKHGSLAGLLTKCQKYVNPEGTHADMTWYS